MAKLNLAEQRGGRAAFQEALQLDPSAGLPPGAAPKLKAIFEQLRSEVGKRKSRAPPANGFIGPPVGGSDEPVPGETAERSREGPSDDSPRVAPWALLGGGGAAL